GRSAPDRAYGCDYPVCTRSGRYLAKSGRVSDHRGCKLQEDVEMRPGSRLLALLAGVPLIVGACSSSSQRPVSQGPPSRPAATSAATSAAPSASTDESGAQDYLDAVNRLCDALLPKVI